MLKLLSQTSKVSKVLPNLRSCIATQKQIHILSNQILSGGFSVRDQHSMANPKMIVFDLDYTLWPFWIDTHVSPPFKKNPDGKIRDARNEHVKYFPDVPEILAKLHSDGYVLGIASRTGAIKDAEDLVRLFGWDKYFSYSQIFPDCKITHFKALHKTSKIPYTDMLFFDDEHRNIKDVSSLGVTCMFVPDDGVTHASLQEGMELFKSNSSKRS